MKRALGQLQMRQRVSHTVSIAVSQNSMTDDNYASIRPPEIGLRNRKGKPRMRGAVRELSMSPEQARLS
jgi:hypothetical protein